MMLITTVYVMLLLQVNAQSTDLTNDSMAMPVFEDPSLATTYSMNIICVSYSPTGQCENMTLIYDHPVKFAINSSRATDISSYQNTADQFFTVTDDLNPPRKCLELLERFLCRWTFATCDPAFNVSVMQPICRRGCDILSTIVCPGTWDTIIDQSSNLNFLVLQAPDCDGLPNPNGGDAPDCTDPTDGGEIPVFSQTEDCFNGRGRGYNGNISITRSRETCQRWSVQAPHQFILPSSQYPEIVGDHNYCRNPGSRGPEGPWCFTADPNTRWEYCDVPKCGPVPSCQLYYNSPEAVCYKYRSIGRDYVFLNSTDSVDIDTLNTNLRNFLTSLEANVEHEHFPEDCVDEIFQLTCHNSLPLCDYNSSTPQPRKICRSYCDQVRTGKCSEFWNELNRLSGAQIITLPDCDTMPSPEGGEQLECFIPYNYGRDRNNVTSTCYSVSDQGIHYNGTVSITMSGKTCQAWDSDTPHFHPLTSLYRPYLEGHNYCRNPEGRGSQPWCYTTDPNTRWEYCSIARCSASDTGSNTDDEDDDNTILIVAIVLPLLLVVALMLIIVLFTIRTVMKRRENKSSYKSQTMDSNTRTKALPNKYKLFPATVTGADGLPNIPRENITYVKDLGEGNFGMVVKGEAKNIIPGQFSTLVAVKILKEGSDTKARNDFVQEAVLVNQFDHPNILKLLGVCFEEEPFYIAFEYMELGDLNKYLRNKAISVSQPTSNITTQQLVDMAINIAAGLEYLAVRGFVHRDLATRNCLINQQLFVKISDFGLSKDIYSKDYYRLGDKSVLPIRWMPPEAIVYSKFNKQSDVWSFGIVLWEIFSSGAQPYYTLSNEEVIEYVSDEKVLRCPVSCPGEIYDLMVDCWATAPEDRPTASDLHTALKNWSPQLSANHAAANHNPPQTDEYVKMESAKNTHSSVLYSRNNGSIDRETFV